MTVTRLPTFNDVLEEETSQCTLCPEAVQRTLATMLDLSLLTSPTFLLLCLSGFTTMMGFFIPFMYLEGKCFAERTQFGWKLGSRVCIELCSRGVNNYFKSKQLSFYCFLALGNSVLSTLRFKQSEPYISCIFITLQTRHLKRIAI